MLDRYGNPIDELHSMTRDLITDFTERFDAARYSASRDRDTEQLLDELIRHEYIHSYIHIIEKDGCYGVYDALLDTMLVPAIYEELTAVGVEECQRSFIARRNGKYGFVQGDVVGTESLPFVYDKITPLGEFLDLFVFEKDNRRGVISACYHHFTELIPAVYDSIDQYPNMPYVQLCKDGKVGLWGTTLPIPSLYDGVYVPPCFGWVKVKHQGQWGYIDNQGHFTDDVGKAFLCHDGGRFYEFSFED